MKSKSLVAGLLMIVVLVGSVAGGTYAATQDEIEQAITDGIGWLVMQQEEAGSWGWGSVGHTGLAVVKLEDRAFELGYNPFDEGYPYGENVIAGLDYIFGQAAYSECCDTCVVFALGHNEVYNTGIAMMAIAASKAPDRVVDVPGSVVDGSTYREVLQANVDYFACSQNPQDGAWRYEYPEEWSDNSASGYAVLGLAYAEAPLYGFQCTIPDTLKSNLSNWIDLVQVDGDTPHNGGSGYSQWDQTSNVLRAANLIFEMAFVGDTPDTERMQRALDYIGRAWDDPDWSWQDMHSYPGWYGNPEYDGNPNGPEEPPEWWQGDPTRWYGWQGPHYQAMYCLMKGLSFAGVDTVLVDSVEVEWYQAFAERILETRTEEGYWPRDYWGDDILATAWSLLTLERVAPPRVVPVDVKPGSCPNPLNTSEKGVLSVAVMGTDEFDVTQIDPASITLEGVSPLRWSLEDAGLPYEPYTGKGMADDCIEYYPDEYGVFDGIYDLSLKFKAQEVIAALGEVHGSDVLVLQLSGSLKEEYGGIAFVGEDVVVITKNMGPTACSEISVIDTFPAPEGSQPHGIAFDGHHLWCVGRDTGRIYQLTRDGDMLSSFVSPAWGPTGLTFDGTYLWHASDNPPTIYQLDTSGTVIRSFAAPGSDSTGLTFEDEYLWNADFDWGNPGGYLHRIDVSDPDGITYTSFASPGECPEGLAFDGTYLWHVDWCDNKIYKLDTSANVICSYPSFGVHPIGLTFDGKDLWLADEATRLIYRVDIDRK